jgi:hypothetical protein
VIVAGIVTALGLNQWVDARTHARQGAQALATIEAELKRNEAVLTNALEAQRAQLAQFNAALDMLGKDSFKAPDLPARAQAVLKSEKISLDFGLTLAALQRSAWETAIASQSLQYIPQDRAIQLSRAYAAMQEIGSAARQLTLSASVFANAAEADAYVRGDSKDALRFARAIRETMLSMTVVTQQYTFLRDTLHQVSRGELGAVPSQAASAAGSAP